ncbi:hypothetical protein ACHAQA_004882 [Verticillium albo-atrum]
MPVAVGCKRELPFLQRNLTRGLKTSRDMGNVASAARNLAGDSYHEALAAAAGRDLRPHKRRRVDSPVDDESALGNATTYANVAASVRSNGQIPSLEDQLYVATEVGPIQRTLRVDVLRIVHKDLTRVRVGNGLNAPFAGPRTISESRARCKITLTHATKTGDTVLHCQSQLCTVRSSKSAADPFPTVRIHLSRAFFIPEDSIFVNRPDNHLFDLADAYKISVELEAAGSGIWPPPGTVPLGPGATIPSPRAGTASQSWVLAGELSQVFSKKRSMVELKLRKSPSKMEPTDYLIDIDAGWSTGFEAGAIRPLERGVEPSIIAEGTPPRTGLTSRNGDNDFAKHTSNGFHNGDILDEDDDEPDGEGTPNRSLRTRENKKNYNLKDLSDKALGRNKKRRKRKSMQIVEGEAGRVCYDLPAEQVNLEDFQCITCGQSHLTLADLQAHLEFQHPEYDYVCDLKAKAVHFQVVHRIEAFSFGDDGTYELKKTVKGFHFGQGTDVDESWLKSDLGLAKENDVTRKYKKKLPPAPSNVLKRKGKVILVPETKQQLFDPVSRMPLIAGTPFIKHKPDDRWLAQWHREAIEDFSDIPFSEREFMTTWDEFMLTRRISSDVYLPSSWLAFLRLKAEWLACSESRMIEFGKHISYLIARDALDDQTIKEGFQLISAAKLSLQSGGAKAQQHAPPAEVQPRKSAANCQTCGRQILGPRLLLCANPDCKERAFHRDCVKRDAKMDVEDPAWLCNSCFEIPAEHRA